MNRSRLVLLSVLVCAFVALVIGSASWASRSAPPGAAAPVLHFQYTHMPADQTAVVTFSDGVQGISTQTAAALGTSTGTLYGFVAHQHGFGITSAEGGLLDASIDLQVQATAGSSAITGQAPVPSGATLTVQVNGGAAMPISGRFTIPLTTLGAPAPKPRPKKPPCRDHKHTATAARVAQEASSR